MEKLLTIIIPCFNMEQYLRGCLDSLSLWDDEHGRLLEVLVINDGSKDNTSQIAHGYAADFPNSVKVVDKGNGHYGSCINAGLSIAQGKFVKILEPDDVFDKNGFGGFLSELAHLEASGELKTVDLLLTGFVKNTPSGQVILRSNLEYTPRKPMDFEEFQAPLKYHILLPAVTYRLSILKEIDYHQTEGCPYTDIEWLCVPMHKVQNVMYLPYVVYMYLIGRDGQTIEQSTFSRNVNVILRLISCLLKRYDSFLDARRPAVRKYVDKVLLAQIAIIYRAYLIDKGINLRIEDLKAFDDLLKRMTPNLYCASDFIIKSKFFSYHYVRCFRKPGLLSLIKQKLFFAYARFSSFRNWLKS